MALTVYREQDANLPRLRNTAVAVIGYGNQGRAHALNLRDSGVNVVVGQRAGAGFQQAESDGFEPLSIDQAVGCSDLLLICLPDECASEIYEKMIEPNLRPGQALGFVHGFNIRYGFIKPPDDVDVIMIAPKGPGTLLRYSYEKGFGIPALMAIHQDASNHAKRVALAWAVGIGAARAGIIETTFAAETEADLFGEQVVLCGGVSALTKAAFETLVEAGYAPELAYLECVHELKQVVDLLYERGLSGMREKISNTAAYGDMTRGSRVIGKEVRESMKKILADIRGDQFAREWMDEYRSGGENFRALHQKDEGTLYEKAGEQVRSLMPWLKQS